MIQRFTRDESGITMAVTVFMVLLIGVMGAGLLTFTMSDLKSEIEVNKGQKAMDIAEAGVQAAKAHLREDSFRQHYDTDPTNDCAEGWRAGSANWSKATQSWSSVGNTGKCDTSTPNPATLGPNPADDPSTPWPEDKGVTQTFGGGRFHVTIECMVQSGDAAISPNPCSAATGDPAMLAAPVSTIPASDRKFFKVTSTGYYPADGTGAIRKVEAIYTTAKKTYAPIAYWTPKSINFSGTKCVSRLSFFAGGNISGVQSGSSACGPNGFIADRSTPALYGDWNAGSPYNTTPRINPATGASITGAGFGAVGLVCEGTQCLNASNSVADGINDYDSTTGLDSRAVGQKKKFVANAPTSQITFPFDKRNALSNPSDLVDPGLIEEMRQTAAVQGNYHPVANGTTYTIDSGTWPASAGKDIVYFVDFPSSTNSSNLVDFKIKTNTGQTYPSGMIIVHNGNFQFNNSATGFNGVVIILGDGTNTGTYKQAGSFTLDGYVSSSGDMTISGNVSPHTTVDFTNLNSFYDVKLWSWRELYQ